MGAVFYLRSDILSKKGLDPAPASFADFKKLCMALTEPRQNKWAIANPTGAVNFVQQMLGVANSWKNDGGKLTNAYELEETKQAIAAVAQLAKAGTVHPDSYDPTLTTDFKQWFNAGNAALDYDNYTAWPQFYVQNVAGPSFKIAGMLPPAYDSGSKPVTWQGNPDLSFTAIKKGDKKRVKMLLEVCNWLSAPFGTEEYLFRTYGIAGRDYEVKNGDPVVTSTGEAEVPGLSIGYIANAPTVLYFPGFPEATKDGYEFQRKFLPMAVANPTLGLYSNTNSTKGSDINLKMTDAQSAILQGREPLSSWDDAVKTWRSAGGDTIRKEYQDALQNTS
jgi:putative aldouronate transport system substrate-binding protein